MTGGRYFLALAALSSVGVTAAPRAAAEPPPPVERQVVVGPGIWHPLYPAEGEEAIEVAAFLLDVRPVTNAEFLDFVKQSPDWRRGHVPALFAGPGYLQHWAGPTELGARVRPTQPVTQVSWWAARAFCASRGDRLPTEAEWELAAMASETAYDASKDEKFLNKILAWYSKTNDAGLADAGSGEPNLWGVRDLHGLVWEWVGDFQSALVAVDNRADGTVDTTLFCGAGAVAAATKDDYAAFMRLAFRASLHAEYSTANLGFRCAHDVKTE